LGPFFQKIIAVLSNSRFVEVALQKPFTMRFARQSLLPQTAS